MIEQRKPIATVGFIDQYCQAYRSLFGDVRSFEQFKFLHVGMLSELPRKTLPAIAKLVDLQNGQSLHHFLRDGVWDVELLRAARLSLIQPIIGQRRIVLCIDETGDVKKGQATDVRCQAGHWQHRTNGQWHCFSQCLRGRRPVDLPVDVQNLQA